MSDIKTLLDNMQKSFNPDAAGDLDAVFQYDITDNGSWQIAISDGACQISEGTPAEANVTLAMNLDTVMAVMSGELDGMQAFMSGDIQATGDIMLATRLADIFPVGG